MPIAAAVFLDIDGVLNSTSWWARRTTMEFPFREFDPACLERLEVLLYEHDAALVISSSWRSGRDTADVRNLFNEVGEFWGLGLGLPERIVGATEVLERERGEEVASFCSEHEVRRYVILDDQTDFFETQPLVWIDPAHGLRDADIDRAARFLAEGPMRL